MCAIPDLAACQDNEAIDYGVASPGLRLREHFSQGGPPPVSSRKGREIVDIDLFPCPDRVIPIVMTAVASPYYEHF